MVSQIQDSSLLATVVTLSFNIATVFSLSTCMCVCVCVCVCVLHGKDHDVFPADIRTIFLSNKRGMVGGRIFLQHNVLHPAF